MVNVGQGASNPYLPNNASPTTGSNVVMRWVVDGGVAANDPAVFAVAEAMRLGLIDDPSEALVVSLGTGVYNGGLNPDFADTLANWGTLAWGYQDGASPLVDLMSLGPQQAADAQLGSILPQANYVRMQPPLPAQDYVLAPTAQVVCRPRYGRE